VNSRGSSQAMQEEGILRPSLRCTCLNGNTNMC
jgi:hypothetical protein